MKRIALALLVGGSLTVQAELLNPAYPSPYSQLKAAQGEEKVAFINDFKTWVNSSSYTPEERKALESLVSENPEVSGDEVLEVLDSEIVAWFYGYNEEGQPLWPPAQGLVHDVRNLGGPDTGLCMKYDVCVIVSKSSQSIRAYRYGAKIQGVHGQPISTARAGKFTPTGTFSVEELAGENRRSNRYNGAYLGYAMQVHGHIFLHATSSDQYGKLGRPASAGCVRMHKNAAKILNGIMRQAGRSNVRVVIKN